uniref:Uncharacterized protein n=1 Tax=Cyclophora tenuis TaxID=216820 RepID=A0A7S1GJU3_CYCTE|mmetsp:Transcript_17506/g.29708  ORF Transcript_17506/g.29708 Transcript_17506/m.29708 type:complete len:117 (+) Transcript_17506:91-441(+)
MTTENNISINGHSYAGSKRFPIGEQNFRLDFAEDTLHMNVTGAKPVDDELHYTIKDVDGTTTIVFSPIEGVTKKEKKKKSPLQRILYNAESDTITMVLKPPIGKEIVATLDRVQAE